MISKSMYTKSTAFRVTDIEEFDSRPLPPLRGYRNMSSVSLDEAVQPLLSVVQDVDRMVQRVKSDMKDVKHFKHGLTIDQSASIRLYTLEWRTRETSFYYLLNTALRSEDRKSTQPWFPFLHLIFTALDRLPSITGTIYRGVKGHIPHATKNKNVTWWGFTSCTSKMNVLESEAFCGKTGKRTIFHISCLCGKDISQYSYYPVESEVLLLPGTMLTVKSVGDFGSGLSQIQIEEILPEVPNREMITSFLKPPSPPPVPPKKSRISPSNPSKPSIISRIRNAVSCENCHCSKGIKTMIPALIFLAVSLTSLIIGVNGKSECNIEPWIPKWLIGFGVTSLTATALFTVLVS